MTRPTLNEFGLTDSEYKSFKAMPKKIEKWFMGVGATLGAIIGFLLAYGRFGFINILAHIWIGLILGSILFKLLDIFIGDIIIVRHKSQPKISAYENALLSYRRTQEDYWKSLKGRDLETVLGDLFSSQGYKVDLTPLTGDRGIDMFLRKEGITIIVQCKSHAKPVGPAIVRDLYGTLAASKAHSAVLVSTSGFTKGVHSFARGKRIELLSLKDIIMMSEKAHATNEVQ